MYIDSNLIFSNNQIIRLTDTTLRSDNVVLFETVKDFACGKPLFIVSSITETFDVINGIKISVITTDDINKSDDDLESEVLISLKTILLAELLKGKQFLISIPPYEVKRECKYFFLNYKIVAETGSETLPPTTGKLTSICTTTPQFINKSYSGAWENVY